MTNFESCFYISLPDAYSDSTVYGLVQRTAQQHA